MNGVYAVRSITIIFFVLGNEALAVIILVLPYSRVNTKEIGDNKTLLMIRYDECHVTTRYDKVLII